MIADARRKVTSSVRSLIRREPPPPSEAPGADEDARGSRA